MFENTFPVSDTVLFEGFGYNFYVMFTGVLTVFVSEIMHSLNYDIIYVILILEFFKTEENFKRLSMNKGMNWYNCF